MSAAVDPLVPDGSEKAPSRRLCGAIEVHQVDERKPSIRTGMQATKEKCDTIQNPGPHAPFPPSR